MKRAKPLLSQGLDFTHMQQYVEPIYVVYIYEKTLGQWFWRWVNGSGFRAWRVSIFFYDEHEHYDDDDEI